MYYKKSYGDVNLGEKLDNIGGLNKTFRILNKLNQILEKILPPNLSGNCHIGAIDQAENIDVLYITQQQLFHVIRNFSNNILQEFANNNFHFDKLLIRNKVTTRRSPQSKELLNKNSREKLSQIANEIGKPDIIKAPTESIANDDEIII